MTSEIKPDAWLLMDSTIISNYSYNLRKHKEDGDIPLFAKREWSGLTDEELKPLCKEWRVLFGSWTQEFAKAIEDKLKEKNT